MSGRESFRKIIFLLLLLLALSFSLAKIFDYDIWWHLKTGEHIWNTFSVPRKDFLALTTEGKEWIDVHWLAQVVFYAVYICGGFSGIQIFTAIVVIVTISILFVAGKEKGFFLLAAPFLYLAIYASKDRYLTRPDIATLFFPSLYFFLLYRFIFYGDRKVYFIPILQAIWVNFHGSFILGPLMIFAFMAGQALEWMVSAMRKRTAESERAQRVRGDIRSPSRKRNAFVLIIIFLLSCAANLASPYGIRLPTLYFSYIASFKEFLLGASPGSQAITIQEWLPTFSESAAKYHHTFFIFYIALAALCFASFLINWKRFSASLLFTFAGFFLLSFAAIRNVAVFSLLAAVIASHNLSGFFLARKVSIPPGPESAGDGWRRTFMIFASACSIIVLLASAYDSFSNRYYLRHSLPIETGFGISQQPFPVGAASFVKEHNPAGAMYNNFESGGFLIWSLYPRYKVFTDGRYIDPALDKVLKNGTEDIGKWQKLAGKYGVEFALLKYPASDTGMLIQELSALDSWGLIFLDSNSTIFMKKTAENKSLIEKNLIFLPSFPDRKYVRRDELPAMFFSSSSALYEDLSTHPVDWFFNRLQDLLKRFQKKPLPFDALNRAYFLHLTGFFSASVEEYRAFLKDDPSYIPAHMELGLIFLQLERYYDALQEMQFIARSGMKSFEIFYDAGFSAFQCGRFTEAITYLQNALGFDQRNYNALLFLSLAFFKTGNLDEAETLMVRALNVRPDSVEALFNLGSIHLMKGQLKKAEDDFERCIVLDPTFKAAQDELQKLQR